MTLICPNCEREHRMNANPNKFGLVIWCGDCDTRLPCPPVLRLIIGGRAEEVPPRD